ncbi:spore-associated protein A [Streptomyces sp. NPDC059740]|uniref:spore-associated protein A n=1 Tax=Streptomyces sp. NPDC059740 TaxID=3346926 RepID=UPI003652DD38
MRLKKSAAVLATVLLAGSGLAATAGVASAATPAAAGGHGSAASAAAKPAPAKGAATSAKATAARAAAYNGACGSGYTVINSAPIGSLGTVYLTYNSAKGTNCVVTQRAKAGTAVPMSATVSTKFGTDTDKGNYTTYAGPVTVNGRGVCVAWGGAISGQSYANAGSNCG